MLFACSVQRNFTAEDTENTERGRGESYGFFDLLAFSGCQHKGEQPLKASRTRPKRKLSNPSAVARAMIRRGDAFPASGLT